MSINHDMIKQFGLELARVAAIAVLPVGIAMIESGAIDWKALGIVGIVAVLKGIDRALHETKVAEKGITRF